MFFHKTFHVNVTQIHLNSMPKPWIIFSTYIFPYGRLVPLLDSDITHSSSLLIATTRMLLCSCIYVFTVQFLFFQILGYPSKPIGLFIRQSIIFRSDSNGEDLEGYAGAGLYDRSVLLGHLCSSALTIFTKYWFIKCER